MPELRGVFAPLPELPERLPPEAAVGYVSFKIPDDRGATCSWEIIFSACRFGGVVTGLLADAAGGAVASGAGTIGRLSRRISSADFSTGGKP